MPHLSKYMANIIYDYVSSDLNPIFFRVFWRVGIALLIGGTLSLFICGQFGISLSPLALGWNHLIHAHFGTTQCAVICGVAFSVIPIFLLRILSSGVLFHIIIHQYSGTQASLLLVASIAMYLGGSFMNEVINISVWTLSTFISLNLIGFIIDEIDRSTGGECGTSNATAGVAPSG